MSRRVAPLDPEQRKALRRKALWKVGDFARYLGISHWQAKSALLRYNVALGGMLLRQPQGAARGPAGYTFFWAALAKHAPDAFLDDPIEQQRRLDGLEDKVGDLYQGHRVIAAQTSQNTSDIAKLKANRTRAA